MQTTQYNFIDYIASDCLEHLADKDKKSFGLLSGFSLIDRATGGFHGGDVITISSDVKQNNFGGNWWSYDKSKAVLGSSSSTYNGAKTVSSDQKSVSWNISSIQTLKSNPNYNPCYFRFTIQYSDINAVSVLRTRTLYHE